jgi:hypothetical protein
VCTSDKADRRLPLLQGVRRFARADASLINLAGVNQPGAFQGCLEPAAWLAIASASLRRKPKGGFTFQVQHVFPEGLGWRLVTETFARRIVVRLHQFRKALLWQQRQVRLTGQAAAHATHGIFRLTSLWRQAGQKPFDGLSDATKNSTDITAFHSAELTNMACPVSFTILTSSRSWPRGSWAF